MITFKIEVAGVETVIHSLDRFFTQVENLSSPLNTAGAYLVYQLWNRITSRPASQSTYSDRYVAWCITHGKFDEKIVGVLTGALIGATAPGGKVTKDIVLRHELESGGAAELFGFLDPGQEAKARGFNHWHKRRFGSYAIEVTYEDRQAVSDIFQNWMDDLASAANEGRS